MAILLWSLPAFTFPKATHIPGHHSQASPSLKAERLVSFARYISWPEGYLSDRFIINVYGNSNFFNYLVYLYADRKVKGLPIEVRQVGQPNEVDGGHILFVANADNQTTQDFLAALQGRPILTIGDESCKQTEDFIIRLSDDGKFQYNLQASEAANLRVSSRLLEVAEKVLE